MTRSLRNTSMAGLNALLLLLVVVTSRQAAADVVDLQCTGSQTLNYSPGLQLTPRNVAVNGSGTFSCPLSSDPAISSGGFDVGPFTASLGCALTGGTAEYSYTWNDGRVSTISATSLVTLNLGVVSVTSTGNVISGPFTGDLVLFTWTGTSPGLFDCLSTAGVTQYSGLTTLTFTSLLN